MRHRYVEHYASRRSNIPTFGFTEEEKFGLDYFVFLERESLVHATEEQLTFGFDLPGSAVVRLSTKGGFSCVPSHPIPYTIPFDQGGTLDTTLLEDRQSNLP